MNIWTGTGRIGGEVKFKTIDGEKPFDVADFSIAISKWQGKGKEDKVSFINCSAMNHSARFVRDYCAKGDKVLISGELEQQSWEKDGVKNSKIIIKVLTIELVQKKKADGAVNSTPTENGGDDSIPF